MQFKVVILFGLLILSLLTMQGNAKVIEVGEECNYKNINDALAISRDKDTIIINMGTYSGNFIIKKSIHLIGKNKPVLDGKNNGTVLTIVSPDVIVEGIIIRNSGILLDKEDAGIVVKNESVTIRNNALISVLFGVYLLKADEAVVENNLIEGKKELEIPRRGDLFRAWYCKNLIVKNNQFKYGRDVIIWFSKNIIIENNNMTGARYGLHFMYNSDCRIIHNIMNENSVGMYLMYSKEILVEQNLIANNRGASGFGAGLKDMDNVELSDNVIADNRVGIFIDNSPRSYDAHIKYERNAIGYNETGMEFTSTLENSYLVKNSFIENYMQVQLSSSQNPDNDYWQGNYWSDYSGYDSDSDGKGDIPYKYDELVDNLFEDKPNLKFFLYSPAINTLNFASQAFPIFQPQAKLVDKYPMTKPVIPNGIPVLKFRKGPGFIILSFLLTTLSGALILVFMLRNRLIRPAGKIR